MVKFSKICSKRFPPPHRSTLLCSNVVKFFRQEIGEIVRYLPHKLSLLFGSRLKSSMFSPQNLAHNVPNFIQIGLLSAEL